LGYIGKTSGVFNDAFGIRHQNTPRKIDGGFGRFWSTRKGASGY